MPHLNQLLPRPAEVRPSPGVFILDPDTVLLVKNSEVDLSGIAQQMEFALFANRAASPLCGRGSSVINLSVDENLPLGPEGYRLEVKVGQVDLIGKSAAGVFYGWQTFRQLLPPEMESYGWNPGAEIPAVVIEDEPRFRWRGMMLDVARHFFPVEQIKRLIDLMAMHKLNTFHWHLVDDQGWRIEIKKYPKLTSVGAWRTKRHVDDEQDNNYGGFYTQDQIREVVEYATDRFVTIVPEIELPGHCSSAITSYPSLGNEDVENFAPEVRCCWGIHPDTYAPKEETFHFLEGVFSEVIDLFPGAYLHVGGDEAQKGQWKESPFAQSLMQREGLTNEDELQSWFIGRIEKFVKSRGRRLIGWDEIQEGGLSPTATVMIWRSKEEDGVSGMEDSPEIDLDADWKDWKWARRAINQGNDVVMCPTSHCYLDHSQEPDRLPIEKVYGFEPIPTGLKPEQEKQVLGLQGNLWTEGMPAFDDVARMAFPRLCALAEIAWSSPSQRNWEEFSPRLTRHLRRLDVLGVKYFKNSSEG